MFIGYIFINLGTVRYIEAFHFGVGFCQLLAILNMFNTNWPANVQTLFNYASVLAFETNIVQPQCVNPSWFYPQNLVTQLLMPLVITACTLLWLMVTWYVPNQARLHHYRLGERDDTLRKQTRLSNPLL